MKKIIIGILFIFIILSLYGNERLTIVTSNQPNRAEVINTQTPTPPVNLTNTITGDRVTLQWLAPNSEAKDKKEIESSSKAVKEMEVCNFTGYKIYRDNEAIAQVSSNTFTFTDVDLWNGSYTYYITTRYGNNESQPSNSTIAYVLNHVEFPIVDSFETYPDFSMQADPWVLIDGDQSPTYPLWETSFEHSEEAMSYIVFNPSMTTPPIEGNEYQAFDGDKYMACLAASDGPNNDWLITPLIDAGSGVAVKFWVKSVSNDYGLERFNVLVSLGSTNPNDFIYPAWYSYTEASTDWTQYSYNLEGFQHQTVRVAIQCVSNDAFMFMVDDVAVVSEGGFDNDTNEIAAVSQLKGNYPNPFNPETTISYFVEKTGEVTLEIYNILGQKVKTLVNESKDTGTHSEVWNGKDDNGKSVASGVFFYRMKSGKYTSTKKMILLK